MLIQVWAYEWSWQSLYTKNTYLLKEKPLTWLDFFLVWFMKNESESHSAVSKSLQPHGLYSPWNSLGHNTGVGSLSLLQGIFTTQGSNSGLPHCRWILYQLSHKGRPRILEWVAYPSPGDLPNPGIELGSPALQEDSLPTELSGKPKGETILEVSQEAPWFSPWRSPGFQHLKP